MAVRLTDKILPLNDAFTGMVDANQVLGGGASGVLPDACMPDLTGDVTTTAGAVATTIANDAVTYAKMQNVSATDKLLGRSTAGSGDVEEIACTAFARSILDDANEATFKATVNLEANTDFYAPGGTDVPVTDGGTGASTAQAAINTLTAVSAATNEHVLTKDTATGNAVFKAAAGAGVSDGDKGDITVSGSGATWTIDNGVVSLAKMADMATASLIYRKTAGTGVPEVNSLATLKTDLGLTGTNSGDQTSIVGITGTKSQFDTACTDGNFLYSGDITQYTDEMAQDAVGGMLSDAGDIDFTYTDATPAVTADIKADSVTYAKMQNVSATDKILGRSTAGSGDVEEITCTATGRSILDDTSVTAVRTTIGANQGEHAVTVESPTNAEDITIFFTNRAITVTEMRAVLNNGSATPSVTWTIRHSTDRNATGNEVVTSGTTTTSITSGSDVTSFNDATIPADSFVWLATTAKSGTVPELHVTIVFTYD